MREFKLSKIWILSDIAKKGNVFTFSPKRNLITSSTNSVGKSSLVKSILWTLGCEPQFDKEWKSLEVSSCLEFTIDNIKYIIFRKKNIFLVIKGNEKFYFDDFRKYVEFFCNLVNFFPLLQNRNTKLLELPSPVYYFVPFYIDQKKGWSSILNSFEKLTQYPNWYKNILHYHCGITNNEISKLEYQISQSKSEISIHQNNKEKAVNACEIFTQINDENILENTLSEEIEQNIEIINNKYSQLIDEQNQILLELSTEKNILHDLKSQRNYSLKLAHEIELDFIYSYENLTTNKVQCPLCGVDHNNTILEKSLLVKDSDNLQSFITDIENQIQNTHAKIRMYRDNLNSISEKLTSLSKNISINSNKIILSAHQQSTSDFFKQKANSIISNEDEKIDKIKTKINRIAENKKNVKKQFSQKEITLEFKSLFNELNNYLRTSYTQDVIKDSNIMSYRIFDTNGGAADSTRSVFLYHSIILNLINKFSTEAIAPFIVDTPNQQEQAKVNYEQIINTLMNKLSSNMQIILCAMDNQSLEDFKKDAKIITLVNEKSLLLKDSYHNISTQFDIFNNEIKVVETEKIEVS